MLSWMTLALTLAAQGRYSTLPNPQVGCVIVKDGMLVGQGFHKAAGEAHAEVLALAQAKNASRGADLYVTLEPCSHYGRTPPCVGAIILSGISRVFIAVSDPNPQVNGEGIKQLRNAGIEVHVGLLAEEAFQLNKMFFHYMRYKRPYVIAKWAMTLDGKIASAQGESKWITGEPTRNSAHNLRAQVSGILVGRRTVVNDNPRLSVRILPEGGTYEALDQVRQPRPVILTSTGDIPLTHHLLQKGQQTFIITSAKADKKWLKAIEERGIEHVRLPLDGEQLPMDAVMDVLGGQQMVALLVEGGAHTLGQLFQHRLIHRVQAYIAPKLMVSKGIAPLENNSEISITNLASLHSCKNYQVGQDFVIEGETENTPRSYKEFLNV